MAAAPDARLRACYATLQASLRSLAAIEREVERQTGLPLAWYEVLVLLAGGEGERRRMSELADSLLLSRGGATRLVTRMEEAGLVCREVPEHDRRATFCVLTDRGRGSAERARPVHEEAVRRFFADAVDDAEAEALRSLAVRVLGLVGDECAGLMRDLGGDARG